MFRRTLTATALLLPVPAVLRAQERDLTIVSWGGAYQDAQREAFFRPFLAAGGGRAGTGRAGGGRILEETWDGGIDLLRARASSGTSNWDLVQVEPEELLIGCREGLFEPMDFDAIGGRDNYIPEAVHPCGVGAVMYSFVLAWDRGRLTEEPEGWGALFDTPRFPGRRALRRGPKTTLEIALLADGVAADAVYGELATPHGEDRAFARLERLRGDLVWWERGSQPPQWLAAGEVVLSNAYNGRIAAANAVGARDLGIGWHQNLFALDFWVIMRGSPNRARALEFLHFIGRPEVQAKLPPLIPYGVTARGANALLPPEVLRQLPTAPRNAAAALRVDDAFWLANIDRLNRRFNDWAAR